MTEDETHPLASTTSSMSIARELTQQLVTMHLANAGSIARLRISRNLVAGDEEWFTARVGGFEVCDG